MVNNRLVKPLYLLPLFLIGCAPTPGPKLKTVAKAPVESGWTEISDAETGISIAIPNGWREGIAPARPTPDSQSMGSETGGEAGTSIPPELQNLQKELEQADQAVNAKVMAALREKGIILVANDGSRTLPAEIPTRISVQRYKDVNSLEAVKEAEATHLFNEDKPTDVDLPAGKAIRFIADGQNRIGDRETHVSYCFIDGDTGYALRLTSTNNPDVVLNNERKVAESFRKQ